MSVLVVGGAGYIGSHVCKALSLANYEPICLDNFSAGHREFVKWGEVLKVDILDQERVESLLKGRILAAVVHLAAKIDVAESMRNPELYRTNNVLGSQRLFRALSALRMEVPIIFSSSAAVYGNPSNMKIDEVRELKPINPYGESKVAVEKLLSAMWVEKKWPSLCLRYFNVAGADPDGEIGEWHDPETHLIPRILLALDDPRLEMKVFGLDYETPDGSCVRDYVHVSDLAAAHVAAVDKLTSKPTHECLNVGYSKGYSVLEVITAVERVTEQVVKHTIADRRPGDPAYLVADSRRVFEALDWKPKYGSSMDEIVRHAWTWHKKLRSLGIHVR